MIFETVMNWPPTQDKHFEKWMDGLMEDLREPWRALCR